MVGRMAEAPKTDFAAWLGRLAGREVTPDALLLLRLATHLGAATAPLNGVDLDAPAHWNSLLGALLLSDADIARWLRWRALGDAVSLQAALEAGRIWPT